MVTMNLMLIPPEYRKPTREDRKVRAMRAAIMLQDNPEWSDRRLAKEIGVSSSTIRLWPEISAVRKMLTRDRRRYMDAEGHERQ